MASPKDNVISLSEIFAVLLIPLGLLTTNINFGMPVAETMPLLFVGVGLLFFFGKGQLKFHYSQIVPGIMFVYGVLGLLGDAPVDGLRLIIAGIVFFIALQLGTEREVLGRACKLALFVLFALRGVSLVIPQQMAGLYEVLGLRSAELYGGGVAILFAEPSYLASATFSMWAIAKSAENRVQCSVGMIDFCAASILLLSGSASAALYALCGFVIVLRRHYMFLLCCFGLLVGTFGVLLALEGNRLSVFANAIVAMAEYGTMEDAVRAFSVVDPSSGFRLTMAVLAFASAFRAPLGHFELEMTRDFSGMAGSDLLAPLASNQLVDSFAGNLQANTVPLQMLYYGGWPLFGALLLLIGIAISRLLWYRRIDGAYLLVVAALLTGCVLQSVLTSPFFYLCVAYVMMSTSQRVPNSIVTRVEA